MASKLYSIMLIVLLSISCSSADDKTQALINQICNQSGFTIYCQSVLNPYSNTPNIDAKGFCQVVLNLAPEHTINTLKYINTVKSKEKDMRIRDLYDTCESLYTVAVDQINSASDSFVKRDYATLLDSTDKSGTYISKCQGILSGVFVDFQVDLQNKQNRALARMAYTSARIFGKF